MYIENDPKLAFKDVLIRPKRSTLSSRSEVSLERHFTFLHAQKNGLAFLLWQQIWTILALMKWHKL